MSDDASPEQKLNIATYFLMSSPVGEVDEVLAGQTAKAAMHTLDMQANTDGWRGWEIVQLMHAGKSSMGHELTVHSASLLHCRYLLLLRCLAALFYRCILIARRCEEAGGG